jgi:hypothetical protein
MFANLYCSLCFSCSSFNFYNLFLDYLCKFSTKLSSALIVEIKNESNLLIENENEKVFWSLLPSEMYSPCFITWRFTFHFRVNILIFWHLVSFVEIHTNCNKGYNKCLLINKLCWRGTKFFRWQIKIIMLSTI